MTVVSESHTQVGHIGFVNVIPIWPWLPVLSANPVHLDLHAYSAVKGMRILLTFFGTTVWAT